METNIIPLFVIKVGAPRSLFLKDGVSGNVLIPEPSFEYLHRNYNFLVCCCGPAKVPKSLNSAEHLMGSP